MSTEIRDAVYTELRILGGLHTNQGREALRLADELAAELEADDGDAAHLSNQLNARFLDLQLNRPGGPVTAAEQTPELNAATARRLQLTRSVVLGRKHQQRHEAPSW